MTYFNLLLLFLWISLHFSLTVTIIVSYRFACKLINNYIWVLSAFEWKWQSMITIIRMCKCLICDIIIICTLYIFRHCLWYEPKSKWNETTKYIKRLNEIIIIKYEAIWISKNSLNVRTMYTKNYELWIYVYTAQCSHRWVHYKLHYTVTHYKVNIIIICLFLFVTCIVVFIVRCDFFHNM